MRLLAVDFGTKRMGVAIGDSETRVVTPLPPFPYRSHLQSLGEVRRLADEFSIDRVLVGRPVLLDGSETSTTAKADRFIAFLRRRLGLPVEAADERLTSFVAEERASESRLSPGRRRRAIDSLAAQLILEAALEERR